VNNLKFSGVIEWKKLIRIQIFGNACYCNGARHFLPLFNVPTVFFKENYYTLVRYEVIKTGRLNEYLGLNLVINDDEI